MERITPPSDLWFDVVLPKDIKSKAFQNIPYPEILYKCDEFCDSDEFWARKAANDTGSEYNQEFKQFYDKGKGNYVRKYIRVLAYNNVAVLGDKKYPGSELYMSPAQMLKIGVDRDDKELIYYSLDNLNKLDEGTFDYTGILTPLADNNMFEELLYIIPKLDNLDRVDFPYIKWIFESKRSRDYAYKIGNLVSSKQEEWIRKFPRLIGILKIIVQKKEDIPRYLVDPNYIEIYYMAKRYGQNLPEPDLERSLLYPIIEGMLNADFVDEAVQLLEKKPNDIISYNRFIRYIVDNDDIKLGYKILDIIPNNIRQHFINELAFKSYSGSRVFEQAFDNVNLDKLGIGDDITRNEVVDFVYKSLLDFEGLHRLWQIVKDKKRVLAISKNLINKYTPAIEEIFS